MIQLKIPNQLFQQPHIYQFFLYLFPIPKTANPAYNKKIIKKFDKNSYFTIILKTQSDIFRIFSRSLSSSVAN